jgi:hypothetical protein
MLPDGRSALVLADPGGELLEAYVRRGSLTASPAAAASSSSSSPSLHHHIHGLGHSHGQSSGNNSLLHHHHHAVHGALGAASSSTSSSSTVSSPGSTLSVDSNSTGGGNNHGVRSNTRTLGLGSSGSSRRPPRAAAGAGTLSLLGQYAATASVTLASLELTLRVGFALASKLHLLHAHSLLHLSLRPPTLLYNAQTGAVQLLDLGSATVLREERADDNELQRPQSASRWMFLAPEQSGKANRVVDSRSDLYSIGAVLYALACGQPPFISNDSIELIHMHLARAPPPLTPLLQRPSASADADELAAFPAVEALLHVVSAMVMKLLSKTAEDRYASAAGLLYDLGALLALFDGHNYAAQPGSAAVVTNKPPGWPAVGSGAGWRTPELLAHSFRSFVLGSRDHTSTLRISQRLYGREQEVSALIQAFRAMGPREPRGASTAVASLAPAHMTHPDGHLDHPSVAGGGGGGGGGQQNVSQGNHLGGSHHPHQGPHSAHSPPHVFVIAGYSGIGQFFPSSHQQRALMRFASAMIDISSHSCWLHFFFLSYFLLVRQNFSRGRVAQESRAQQGVDGPREVRHPSS